jgi:hypothetical protein
MKIIFTICSNNYLAQAKCLGDSIRQTNPDYQFFIGLSDKLNSEIDYEHEIGHPVIPCEDIGIPDFDSLWKKYTIIELNTTVKPFYFDYFIKKYPEIDFLYYFDPDTYVFNSLTAIENEFGNDGSVLLTPHILTPISVGWERPNEQLFLNYGIYNLGFLGLKNPHPGNELIAWWMERLYHLGFNLPVQGLFTDQLWINYAPLFFKNVVISRHPGLNMAPWNLHERTISASNNVLHVNGSFPLTFYHFSNYKYISPGTIAKSYTRYSFSTNPDLNGIYHLYHESLILNGIQKMEKIKCSYMEQKEMYLIKKRKESPKETLMYYLEKLLPQKAYTVVKIMMR